MTKRIFLAAALFMCLVLLCSCSMELPAGTYIDKTYGATLTIAADAQSASITSAEEAPIQIAWQTVGSSTLLQLYQGDRTANVLLQARDENGGAAMVTMSDTVHTGSYSVSQTEEQTALHIQAGDFFGADFAIRRKDDSLRVNLSYPGSVNYSFQYQPVVYPSPVGSYSAQHEGWFMLMTLRDDGSFVLTGLYDGQLDERVGTWTQDGLSVALVNSEYSPELMTISADGSTLTTTEGVTFTRE